MRPLRPRPTWLALAAALASPAIARADGEASTKRACVEASEQAQQLQMDGKLIEARDRLLSCVRPECPELVRHDCAQWMSDVVAALPTVVLGARDAQGRDLFDVTVKLDGAAVAAHLDGKPLPVDPGPHTLRFEAPAAGAPVEMQVIARAGEKNRSIVATWGAPAAPASAAAPAGVTGATPSATATGGHGIPALGWVLGAAAAVALGTALYFEVAQVSDYDGLASTCSGHCTSSQVSRVSNERWAAGIAAGVGVALLGGATYVVLARPGEGTGTAATVGVAGRF